MATLEDLLNKSSQDSPLRPLHQTTLSPDDSAQNPSYGGRVYDEDTYQWDTTAPEYDFGEQRLEQGEVEAASLGFEPYMNQAGPSPIRQAVWKKDVRSSGGSGGQVFRDFSDETFDYNQRVVKAEEDRAMKSFRLQEQLAKQRLKTQQDQYRLRKGFLQEREPYKHPIADLF